MKLPSLSFGFTVNRPLDTCVHLLQDEDRRLLPSYKVYVSPIDNTLCEFYVDETYAYFPAEAKGELKYLDYDKTLVSGEIYQQIGSGVWVLLAFVVVAAIFLGRIAIAGDGYFGLLVLVGYAVYIALETRIHTSRILAKIKQTLDPNFLQTMRRKSLGE